MSAAALVARATAAGVRLWVEGGQVRVRAARPPAADLLAALRAERDDVLRLLTAPPPDTANCDAWGLTEEKVAVATCDSRLSNGRRAPAAPEPMDHDEGEQRAMAAHYAAGLPNAYRRDQPDELRDGLHRGFHAHRHVWSSLSFGTERGAAFADARREPGACPTCAGHRWWHGKDEPPTALRCFACHPPDHLKPEDVETVTR